MSTATLERAFGEVASYVAGPSGNASTSNIYAGEGVNLSAGSRRRRERNDPRYLTALTEAAELYARVIEGDAYAALRFAEAMTTSDFSHLFGDILDRQILAKYQQAPVQWDAVARRGRVRDFRTVKRFTLDGGEAVLSEVKQQAEYPAAALTDGEYSYAVKKYGRRVALSWEALINDDLDAFRDIPSRLGNAARRTEERFATALFAASTGPNATFFSSGNKNLVTAGAGSALSVSSLQAAYTLLGSQVDTEGAPIYVDGVTLMVPPALEVVALNIVNATEILAAAGGGVGTGGDQVRAQNWMRNKVRVVVNPWLPIITTTGTVGNTAWYLFANPSTGRPALEVGFLIGHETPELFQKSPNAVRVGGGLITPEDGDFDTDSSEWKLRHVLGGTLMDSKSAVASPGQ